MLHSKLLTVVAAAAIAFLSRAPSAAAQDCNASNICPGSGACSITGTKLLTNGCVLDFGTRAITVLGTLQQSGPSGAFTVKAGTLTVDGGRLRALGDSDERAGNITVETTGAFVMKGAGAKIEASANGGGGSVSITSASIDLQQGVIEVNGGIGANCGDAGEAYLTASGSIAVAANVTANTPGFDCWGGDIWFSAASVSVSSTVSTVGGASTGITVEAMTGNVELTSTSLLRANGLGSDGAGTGGVAGSVDVTSAAGAITSAGKIEATGAPPDGTGGTVTLLAETAITVSDKVDVGGSGDLSDGGSIELATDGDITVSGDLAARSGSSAGGGDIVLIALEELSVSSLLDVRGGTSGGGDMILVGHGLTTVSGTLNARSTAAGDGGDVDIEGCRIDLSGDIDVGTPSAFMSAGAANLSSATMFLLPGASILAQPCLLSQCTTLQVRSGSPSIDPGALLQPAPLTIVNPGLATCCGNGVIDTGETCDDHNVESCDGCTQQCIAEPNPPCPSDGNECTEDCRPNGGCVYEPLSDIPCADDGNQCTTETCQDGVCAHPAAVCSDFVPCTFNRCDPQTGCYFVPNDAGCNDGSTCTTDVCDPVLDCVNTKVLPDGAACDDGDACTTGGVCDGNECATTGEPLNCDDGDDCTSDACDSGIGCVSAENPAACPCTSAGSPLPQGTACVDGNGCTVGDQCNGAGSCTPGPVCPDEGDPCTTETCLFGSCAHFDNACPGTGSCVEGQPCSDGLTCTTGICQGGVCVPTPLACDDGDACTGIEFCLEGFGCRNFSYAPSSCEGGLDHFVCYKTRRAPGSPLFTPTRGIAIDDSIAPGAHTSDVVRVAGICFPANVQGSDPGAPGHEDHLQAFKTKPSGEAPPFAPQLGVSVLTPLGLVKLDLIKRENLLLAPAALDTITYPGVPAEPNPDAEQCYKVRLSRGTSAPTPVVATGDALGTLTVQIKKPEVLCAPASIDGSNPDAATSTSGLLCVDGKTVPGNAFPGAPNLFAESTFGPAKVSAVRLDRVCFPVSILPPPS